MPAIRPSGRMWPTRAARRCWRRRIASPRSGSRRRPRRETSSRCSTTSSCPARAAPPRDSRAMPVAQSGDDEVFAGSTAPPTPSASALFAPETAGYRDFGNRVTQAKWTSPMSNRLLLEAGFGMYRSRYGGGQLPGLETENLIRVVEAVRRRLRRQRQHPRADVPVAQLDLERQLEQPVERGRVARHRQSQHQDRLPGRAAHRSAEELREHRVSPVPGQQRRSRSADA